METTKVGSLGSTGVDGVLDGPSLDSFVRDHHARLVRLARLVCHDASEADDAVQAALEQAWRKRTSLRDRDALASWLDRIIVREAIRLDRRRRSTLVRLFAGRPIEELVDDRAGVDPLMTELRIGFEALPADQRAAIVLHLHYGYTVAETAGILGAPLETVRSRLRLGRDRLRKNIGEHHR